MGIQSDGVAVFDHDVVAVGETAQFFCRRVRKRRSNRRSQNRLRQTAAVRRLRVRRFGRGRLKVGFQTTSMLTVNEIVKEPIFQTTSKKIVRLSEKRKPRACVLHISYVRTEGFVRATACYIRHVKIGSFTQAKTCELLGQHHSRYQLPKYLKSTLCNWTQQ